VRREAVKRRVGPALYQAMEPGDQIIAGTLAISGSAPAWDALAALPALAGGIAGGVNLFSNVSGPAFGADASISVIFGTFLMLLFQLRRGPVFLAVTQRQLICYRLARMDNEPTRLLFCAPLAAVRMTSLRRRMPFWRSVRYSGPGTGDRSLRFNVQGNWRKDLDEVLAALQAGGAAVEGAPPRPVPTISSPL
jgi:hypothetical protein